MNIYPQPSSKASKSARYLAGTFRSGFGPESARYLASAFRSGFGPESARYLASAFRSRLRNATSDMAVRRLIG